MSAPKVYTSSVASPAVMSKELADETRAMDAAIAAAQRTCRRALQTAGNAYDAAVVAADAAKAETLATPLATWVAAQASAERTRAASVASAQRTLTAAVAAAKAARTLASGEYISARENIGTLANEMAGEEAGTSGYPTPQPTKGGTYTP